MKARRKRRAAKQILSRFWLIGVLLLVVVVASYGVGVVEHMSDAIGNPSVPSSIPATVVEINPKNVTYEVFGDLGSGGKVTYADLNSQPIEVTLTSLPWSHAEATMSPAATLSLVSQVVGSSLGCRITVNGQVRDEQFVSHESAAIACTVIAA